MAEKDSSFSDNPDVLYRQLQALLMYRHSKEILKTSTEVTRTILNKLPIKKDALDDVITCFGDFIAARIEVFYMPKALQPRAMIGYEHAEHALTESLKSGLEFEAEQTVPLVVERIKAAVDTKLGVIRERK
ncbi:MAG: hypothetical protein ACN2B6_03560 [Rickettsiales bacterium]